MRRLIHLVFQPASRLVRLALGEKRLVIDPQMAEDTHAHMPQFIDLDGTTVTGLWAILDHLEGTYPEIPLVPDEHMDAVEHAIVAGNSGQSTPMTQDDWARLRLRAHEVSANKSARPH